MASTVTAAGGKTALILGATGQTGQKILQDLLQSPHFTKVGEYGRRVTDKGSLPASGSDKLVQKTIDFEKLGEAGLKEHKWDVVFIALGTTRKLAGSAEAFEKIDREYVINAAREAKSDAPGQRLVYVSLSRKLMLRRSKGLTENGLAALGYSDTIVFRPSFLAGTDRGDKQELKVSLMMPLISLASHFTDNAQIQISTLAKSVVAAGWLGTSALPASALAAKEAREAGSFTLINNRGALALAAEGQ
ncbi:hypothetical protein H0H92_003337 [Tricholoma furcatifolium]|nr:hypothetical protein H0H92_003337 [Tricholoma furcatifolium]